jgi:hypothetical protein
MLSSGDREDVIVYMGNGRLNLPSAMTKAVFITDGFREIDFNLFQAFGSTVAFERTGESFEFDREALIFDGWDRTLTWGEMWERLPDHFHFARLSGHRRFIIQCSYSLPSHLSVDEALGGPRRVHHCALAGDTSDSEPWTGPKPDWIER